MKIFKQAPALPSDIFHPLSCQTYDIFGKIQLDYLLRYLGQSSSEIKIDEKFLVKPAFNILVLIKSEDLS